MTDKTRKPFQFSLRTVLVLLLIIAAALGFWPQERRLAKARRILAAHGLAIEWPDLKSGPVRATVLDHVENESYVMLTVSIESREPGSMWLKYKKSDRIVWGAALEQTESERFWTGEVRVVVDRIRSFKDGGALIKRVLAVGPRGGWAQIEGVLVAPNSPKLSEYVKVHFTESDVYELGESIPFIDVGAEHFELVVE